MEKYFFMSLCLAILLQNYAFPQSSSQGLMEFRVGYSTMPTTTLRSWAAREGVENISNPANNIQLGAGFLITLNKTVIHLGLDLELGSGREARSRTNAISLGIGRQFKQSDKLDIHLLLSACIGELGLRFREQIPLSFQSFHEDRSYARAYVLNAQPLIQFIFRPAGMKETTGFISYIGFKLGANVPIIHGRWQYGYNDNSGDATVFIGQNVDMPKFYQYALFTQFSIGVMF